MPHTEGTWELLKLDKPADGDWTGGRFIIREPMHAPGGIAVTIGGVGQEEEANAKLMRAAPQMYQTLRTIAGFAPGNGDVCEIIAKRARVALKLAEEGE